MSGGTALDVAIIGGGTAGCAAALALAAKGARVAVFERATVGSQASGVNYGGVREQGRALVELPLSRRARAIWDRLGELVGNDCEFQATGHLKLARSESEMAELERFARGASAYGLEIELIGRNALRDRYPWLSDRVVGASLCRSDGQANPRLVAPSFAQAARQAGAEICEHEGVIAATRDAGGFRLETERGRRAVAAAVVNAAGAWGARVAAWFGETAPLEAQPPNMQVTEPLPYRLDINLGVVGGDVYARQIPRGNLIFGGGRGWIDQARERTRPATGTIVSAMAGLVEILPWTSGAHVIRTWSGIEGFMSDDIPVIGPSRTTPGLVHAFGFSGHGFQLGPVMGEILAEVVDTGQSSTPIEAFSIGRFVDAAPDGESRSAENGQTTRDKEKWDET